MLVTLRGKPGWREVEVGRGSSDATCPTVAVQTWIKFAKLAKAPSSAGSPAKAKTVEQIASTTSKLPASSSRRPLPPVFAETSSAKTSAHSNSQVTSRTTRILIDFTCPNPRSGRWRNRGNNKTSPSVRSFVAHFFTQFTLFPNVLCKSWPAFSARAIPHPSAWDTLTGLRWMTFSPSSTGWPSDGPRSPVTGLV